MLAVIAACYDAALDETLWPTALKQLADFTGSQAASFWVLDGSETPRLPTFLSINFDETAIKEYLEHTSAIDPTVQYLVTHPNEAIVHDGLVISEREKDEHPYYDWHNRNIETRFRMIGQARLGPSVQAGVALHRTSRAGRYERDDVEKFEVLHRHLERALAIAVRIGSLAAIERFTEEWLNRNDAAVVLLDDRRNILFGNLAARSLDLKRDGLRLTSDGIALSNKQEHNRLQSLIAQALTQADFSGGNMSARRPSGRQPFAISVSPVSRAYPAVALNRPAACVIITGPEDRPPLSTQRLRAIFSLTAAEARLAILLANGEDLRGSAEQLRITYGTARARLAQIFQKTETRRQADLVRLLLTSPLAR
jgi:DNA-binding CsgD family transcriptional regulator